MELGTGSAILLVAALAGLPCIVIWFLLAFLLKLPSPRRELLAAGLPLFSLTALLWFDDAPFSRAFAVFALPPATLVCFLAVRLLEKSFADHIG